MEFDPLAAFPAFVNQPTDNPRDVRAFDPWGSPNEFAGNPKPVADVFNPTDFSSYDFLAFVRNELHKPRKVIKQNFNDRLFGDRENVVGTSDDE